MQRCSATRLCAPRWRSSAHFLTPRVVLLDDAKAVAIVQNVLDAPAEQFGDSQARCRQQCKQHPVLTFRTLDDLTHLLVGEREKQIVVLRESVAALKRT